MASGSVTVDSTSYVLSVQDVDVLRSYAISVDSTAYVLSLTAVTLSEFFGAIVDSTSYTVTATDIEIVLDDIETVISTPYILSLTSVGTIYSADTPFTDLNGEIHLMDATTKYRAYSLRQERY